jgi:subtilisin family serine protease
MKTRIIGTVTTLCLVSLSSFFGGCAEVDPLIEDNDIEAAKLSETRAGGESPYYFYDHENQKIYLSLDTKYAFLSAKESALPSYISGKSIKATEFKTDLSLKKHKVTAESRFYTEMSLEESMSDEQYLEFLSDIRQQNKDVIVAPYFNDQYGSKIGLSNLFYVKLKRDGDVALLEKTAKEMACIVVYRDEFMPLWFTLSVTETSKLNALESANFFHESGLFSSAEPDLMADIALSNDTYFGQQYYLKNTGQNGGTRGIDINVEPAWQISTGSNVIVAVIDTGIDLEHEDLKANKYPSSFDAESGISPQQIRGEHGTAVAGIIGTVKDNGKGIAGVAPNSKIMAISHSLVAHSNARQQLAAAISWARTNGAHVINCSWGHPTALSGSYISDAINLAVTQGRVVNGVAKGCVVVAASGNDGNSYVSFPASLQNVIAVGAIDKYGAVCYYSNRGSELNVVAPSGPYPYYGYGNGDVYTTDITGTINGNIGYESGNYAPYFSGTSAAAPQVSGIAALILSKYPNFTRQHVVDLIQSTADRYPGRNNEYGYGLVNAYKALLGHLTPSGLPYPGFRVDYTYSVPATLPTGVTFNGWSVSRGDCIIYGNSSTERELDIAFNGFGDYTLTANYTLPDNSSCPAPLTVTVPHSLPTPQIHGYGSGTVMVYSPITGATYEWQLNGQSIGGSGDAEITIPSHMSGNVRCRAYYMGVYSAWSSEVYVSSYAPAPNAEEEEETSGE